MEISSRDNSSGAEIERLKANQAALEARLAAVEPAPKQPKPDLKAVKAEEAARRKAIAALRDQLGRRHVHMTNIDKFVERLCEAVRAERETRHGLLTEHGKLIEKELRRAMQNDTILISSLRRKIADALRPNTDSADISFERFSDEQETMILQKLEDADIDDLLA